MYISLKYFNILRIFLLLSTESKNESSLSIKFFLKPELLLDAMKQSMRNKSQLKIQNVVLKQYLNVGANTVWCTIHSCTVCLKGKRTTLLRKDRWESELYNIRWRTYSNTLSNKPNKSRTQSPKRQHRLSGLNWGHFQYIT